VTRPSGWLAGCNKSDGCRVLILSWNGWETLKRNRQTMARISFSSLSLLFSRTDEEAMWRVKSHDDHRAFAQLVERWEQPIRRLCARMTGDPHRGDDLKQETFARLFERRKSYEPTGRFSTYLWRIALNICHDEIRRVARRREFVLDGENDDNDSGVDLRVVDDVTPDTRVAELEEGELVRNALLRLPEIYRTVLVLRHYEGLKLAKIAEILEVPEGTVNSRMAEALARLTRILEPQLGGDRMPSPGRTTEHHPREILVI
jgi:RNA polymerase sigma-70 factor (ECF subfamily)